MIEPGDEVQVTKVGVVDDPSHDTPTWDEYKSGDTSGKSVPVHYTVKGFLLNELEPGAFMNIDRYERNGHQIHGVMRTSRIQEVVYPDDGTVMLKTHNSVYEVETI